MQLELSKYALEALKKSDLWTKRTREGGSHITGLVCPECRRPEAWANSTKPSVIICNRKNNCGAVTRITSIFPEILESLKERNPPTKEDPNRPARVYLQSRGLDKSLEGLEFEYWPNVRNLGRGAVMFPLGGDCWNGRILNPPPGEQKGHSKGEIRGKSWKHPGREYDPEQTTFVTEGIINALSLIEMGFQAVAVLSSGADPDFMDLGDLAGNLCFAFDNDGAGGKALKKWKGRYPDAADAITPVNGDWNDLLVDAGDAEEARAYFDAHLAEFRVRARLQLAKKATEYADIWHDHYGFVADLFDHGGQMWSSTVKRSQKGEEKVTTSRAGNFIAYVDHYQLDSGTPDEPVYRYHLVIKPRKGPETRCSFTGAELAQSGGLRAAFLTRARVLWEGESEATKALARRITESKAPVVRQVSVMGYDGQSGAFVFKDFAISRAGSVLEPDKRGFFKISSRELLRPPSYPSLNPEPGIHAATVYELISRAWPKNGPLAMAYTVASWFVETIRPTIGFFPFLSLHGDPQSGKSRLVRVLNAIQCLDEEGIPMSRLNTGKGEIRRLAQRAGLFIAMLEANNVERIRFDLDSLLTLYNHGNPLQTRARKTNGLETQELPFRASLVFVQNVEPFRTKAQNERVLSSKPFRTIDITLETTTAFRELVAIPSRKLAHVFVELMEQRRQFERAWEDEYRQARDEVFKSVSDNRIAENHGLILAFHRLLCRVLNVKQDLSGFVTELAGEKQKRCSTRPPSLADHFFECLNELDDAVATQCCELKDGKVYIKLPSALKLLDERGFNLNQSFLIKDLRDHEGFVFGNHSVKGKFGFSGVSKAWVFESAKVFS